MTDRARSVIPATILGQAYITSLQPTVTQKGEQSLAPLFGDRFVLVIVVVFKLTFLLR